MNELIEALKQISEFQEEQEATEATQDESPCRVTSAFDDYYDEPEDSSESPYPITIPKPQAIRNLVEDVIINTLNGTVVTLEQSQTMLNLGALRAQV